MSQRSTTSQPNTTSLPLYLMTSTENIYQVDGRLFGGTEQTEVNASFAASTAPLLEDADGNTLKEQEDYLNQAVKAGFYAWSPLVTEDKLVRIKATLNPAQGVVKPFGDESYSSGLAYALSCSLHMALKRGWCEKEAIPTTPYFCTGRVSESGEIGAVGEIIKKVSEALKYITPNLPFNQEDTKTQEIASKPPLFHVFLPKANYDNNTKTLTSKDISSDNQKEWQALVEQIENQGGTITGLANVSEGLALILGDTFIPSSGFGIEQTPMGLKAINYTNRRHFFGRKLKTSELAKSAEKAYLTSSALTITGFSGSGKSSIALASLLPELMKEDNGLDIPRVGRQNHVSIKPTEYSDLASYLTPLLQTLTTAQAVINNWLTQPLKELSAILTKHILEQESPIPYTVWVLDQYEELFNTSHITPEEVTQLSQFLKEMAATKQILIITIVRLEYYNHTGVVAGERFTLLDQDKAKEFQHIIKEHQLFFGVDMASTDEQSGSLLHKQPLEERILGDVAHVPLSSLAFLLQKLYEKMKEHAPSSGLYTHDYYDALQGIEGVMTSQAELALEEGLADVTTELHEALTDAFFEAFISVDENDTPIVKVVLSEHIENYQVKLNENENLTIWPLVNAFMSKGLIVDCGSSTISKLKLSHDSIISVEDNRPNWKRMVAWFQSHDQYINWNKSIEDNLKLWLEHRQDRKLLIKNSKEIKIGKEFAKQGHNIALKSFIKKSSTQRKNKLVTTATGIFLFTAATIFLANLLNEEYKHLKDKLGVVEGRLTSKQEELTKEVASRSEIIELEIKGELINHIANLGLYVPDNIVINKTDAVRQVIRDRSLTFDIKQQKLDELSRKKLQELIDKKIGDSTKVSLNSADPKIMHDLKSKGFIFNIEAVRQTPELHRLLLETESMDDKDRQYWLDIMPSMTDEQVDRLYGILNTERTKLDQLEVEYTKKIRALNEKHLIEWQDFQAKDKGLPVAAKSTKEKLAQAKKMPSEHVNESNVLLKEILDAEKDAQTWVSIEAYGLLGENYYKLKESKKALSYWLLELELREGLDLKLDDSKLYNRYWNISSLYVRLLSYEQAIEYSHKSINLLSKLLPDEKKYNRKVLNKKIAHLWRNIVTYKLMLDKLDDAKNAFSNHLKYSKEQAGFSHINSLEYYENIILYNKSVVLIESVIAENKYNNKMLKRLLASQLGRLSWYYLFVNDPRQSLIVAEKGLKLSPEQLWIKGNRAHANFFLGNYKEALMAYKFNAKYKINDSQTFIDATLADFTTFKEAGLTHPDLDKMIKEVSSFQNKF